MRFLLLSLPFFFFACQPATSPLFKELGEEETGVSFNNQLTYSEQINPYTYKNFYNGGGVAIGDINNDGLVDIFFCGNMVSNKLYLNKGDFQFEDITERSQLATSNIWSSGVSMVDINNDGLLDIYVCKSGPPGGERRYNELFVNNGDLTFREESKKWGLDNEGLSSHAAFFDYDRDGDLDCYLLNNSIRSVGSYDLIKDQRQIPDTLGGNKLLRNDGHVFVDVTESAGIYSSDIGFGLGVTIGDVNQDNWPDIYVSNDFFERDYLYLNQGDGTFQEDLESRIQELSMGSMGADFADINNDGHSEFFVTEMLPRRHDRLVSKAIFESWDKHQLMMDKGYHHQYGRNVLQLNNSDGTFSEIGRYAGVEATDWSWGALIFDMDNDGLKDLFVANGIYKDLLDLDYVNFMSEPGRIQKIIKTEENAIKTMIDMMPSEALHNYAFQNKNGVSFQDQSFNWGFEKATFSNGSAYGDLDNDGDLDLVVNNVNMPALIYENQSELKGNHYLALILKGAESNRQAIGAKVKVSLEDEVLYQELNPFRGFQSTVDSKIVFGLGDASEIKKVQVIWPDGNSAVISDPPIDTTLVLQYGTLNENTFDEANTKMWFRKDTTTIDFVHLENNYVDFDKDRLMFEMNSTEGPCLCKGDVNLDGQEDFFIGGANEQTGALFIQSNGSFRKETTAFQAHAYAENLDCAFFDANGDGNPDLYVASGSSEFGALSSGLRDRLYYGDGQGNFSASEQKFPGKGLESSSVVVPLDFDGDGDLDLFIGGRQRPGFYGVPINSHILVNDGAGNFENQTEAIAPDLISLGMVTDAVNTDLDLDGKPDLVIVGKWMAPVVLSYDNGKWQNRTRKYGIDEYSGLYNTVTVSDLNGDEYPDLLFGNLGENTRYRASSEKPLGLLVNDFDNNGAIDLVPTMYFEGEQYPLVQLKDLTMQLPGLKKNFLKASDYKDANIHEIFGERVKKGGYHLKVNKLASFVWFNDAQGDYTVVDLPFRAQLFPIYSVLAGDLNDDQEVEVLLGGNFFKGRPEMGSYKAGYTAMFRLDQQGNFKFVPNSTSGIMENTEVRKIVNIEISNRNHLIFAINNEGVAVYEHNE